MMQTQPQDPPLYIVSWIRALDFAGRATRTEYWTFQLVNLIALALLVTIGGDEFLGIAVFLLALPTVAVTVRRLRDALGSGWWIFLWFVPFIGIVLVSLILPLMPSRLAAYVHANAYPNTSASDWDSHRQLDYDYDNDYDADPATAVGRTRERTRSWGGDSAGAGDDPWDRR